jgi:hypothetical protein
MVYVCCYGDEFKFFKLRKEQKREEEKEGKRKAIFFDLPAPKSEVFSQSASFRQRKKEG